MPSLIVSGASSTVSDFIKKPFLSSPIATAAVRMAAVVMADGVRTCCRPVVLKNVLIIVSGPLLGWLM